MGRPKKSQTSYPTLAPYKRELPPLPEFALLAAILGPQEGYPGKPNEAFARAVKFYQQANEFHEAYAKGTPEERARLCGECMNPVIAKLRATKTKVPPPKSHPGTFAEFLENVVKGKDESDRYARLRAFFHSECPQGQDAEAYAAQQIESLKKPDAFAGSYDREPSSSKWDGLGFHVLKWHKEQVAATNRANKLGKTKQPPATVT